MADKSTNAKKVLEDISSHTHQLKKTAGPAEPLSQTTAKVLLEVTKKQDLAHVDAPKGGLSEAERQAYLEEKKQSGK